MSVDDDLIYLFYIKTNDGREYYLTSASKRVYSDHLTYLPYSGLTLISGKFNDSAENHIIIHGIFEPQGIEKHHNLTGSKVKVMRFRNNSVSHLVTYICSEHIIYDLDFEIKCESESIKYNQSLLQMFSKTCRANLGDKKCKVIIEDYKVVCNLLQVKANVLTCNIDGFEDGYFKYGYLMVAEHKFKIISHVGYQIEIENNNFDFLGQKRITLIPACDKNFRTCCYSFNNAVNFRGEPVIPEYNFIKN